MEAATSPRAAVFTDLDGTLLEAASYSWEPALAALEALRRRGTPVVACTSKTARELAALAPRIGLAPPAVVENGAAIAWSFADEEPAEAFAAAYPALRTALLAARRELALPLTGFGDLDASGIARVTGLPQDDAERARVRVGDEPFWSGRPLRESEVSRLEAHVAAAGLRLTRGGRFFHLHGKCDKGAAVRRILARWPSCRVTAGFGDAANDVSLLEAVQARFAVRRPDGGVDPDLAAVPGVRVLSAAGPLGFHEGVQLWLAESEAGGSESAGGRG